MSFLTRVPLARCVWIWCVCCLGYLPSTVEAQPLPPNLEKKKLKLSSFTYDVVIQATTALDFSLGHDDDGRPFIRGRLRDDQGRGIGNVPVILRLPTGGNRRVKTDKNGFFRVLTEHMPRKGLYRFSFKGNASFAPSSKSRELDMRKVDVDMKLPLPKSMASGVKQFSLKIHMSFRGKAIPNLPVTLYLSGSQAGAAGGKKNDKGTKLWPLMTERSGKDGYIHYLWKGKPLQGPANMSLLFHFPGNDNFLPQRKNYTLRIQAPSPLLEGCLLWGTLVAGVLLIAFGGFYMYARNFLKSVQKDQDGPPPLLPDVPIALSAEERIVFGAAEQKAADYTLAGKLTDTHEKVAIPLATISLVQEGEEDQLLTSSDKKGYFLLELPEDLEGEIRLRLEHPCFQEKILFIEVPHYGQGRRLHIQMTSYRSLIYGIYRKVAIHFMPKTEQAFRVSTARQFLQASSKYELNELPTLVGLFENSYYDLKFPNKDEYKKAFELFSMLSEAHKV